MGKNRYLTRKVQSGEIVKESLKQTVQKSEILSKAPDIIAHAVAKGWISYPSSASIIREDNPDNWLAQYDCEQAYHHRQNGTSYRALAKMLKCSTHRVIHILRRGEEISIRKEQQRRKLFGPEAPPIAVVHRYTTVKAKTKQYK